MPEDEKKNRFLLSNDLDSNVLPPTEQRALQTLNKDTAFNGRNFETHLLWKHKTPSLHYNRNLVIKLFQSLEKKLTRTQNLQNFIKTKYLNTLN